jgi:predicted transposase YbfD/YdcC
MATPSHSLRLHFTKLVDPRVVSRTHHSLMNIITIAICGVICGCKDWQQMETWAESRLDWLAKFLSLENGVRSHDTFERVFEQLSPSAFQSCFRGWVAALADGVKINHIAIDGKTLRGSGDSVRGFKPLHIVSAWTTDQHLSLAEVAIDAKSNEITAIPRLWELLELKGALVTIDAMGCQKAIAQKIRDRGGDYVLTVKDNQEHLLEDIQNALAEAYEVDFAGYEHDTYETTERGHGREEQRIYTILHSTYGIRNATDWADLTTIGICYTRRTTKGVVSEESRYFIGSKKANARTYGRALRGPWGHRD